MAVEVGRKGSKHFQALDRPVGCVQADHKL